MPQALTFYLIAFELQSEGDHAPFFQGLAEWGAKQALPNVWACTGPRAPASTAEDIRNDLGRRIDRSLDRLIVCGSEVFNLAACGPLRNFLDAFNLPAAKGANPDDPCPV
jgi:hypothetical protein